MVWVGKAHIRRQINFGSIWMSDASYSDCNNVRSYITGVNKYDIAEDNDYGDIIVADFNFDKKMMLPLNVISEVMEAHLIYSIFRMIRVF
jgi:hypothetical protein